MSEVIMHFYQQHRRSMMNRILKTNFYVMPCTYHFFLFFFQLIFRKVSDVLKEQELAERRKNDPVLNHTQDHLVRKLFSKFKKGDAAPGGSTVGPGSGPSPNSTRLDKDLEKGEVNLATIAKTALNSKKDNAIPEVAVTDVTNSSEPSAPAPAPVAAPAAPKLKGWARFKGAAAAPPPPAPTPVAPAPPAAETTVAKESTTAPVATTLKVKEAKKEDSSSEKKQSAADAEKGSGAASKKDSEKSQLNSAEYQAINDRLNRIENLIADFMVKLEDKTRSIEKSVAKARSSKSKHAKPHSVTICVDSSGNQGQQDSNCDEQYL